MKNKLFLLTFIVIFALFCTVGCEKDREYDEATVLAEAKELIEKSIVLNELYFGVGISYEMNESEANGYYYPADVYSQDSFGIETVDDIKELTRLCFTVDYSNQLINTKLTAVTDEDGNIRGYARYYQKYNALDDTPECIMVYKNAPVYLKDKVTYHYETLAVTDVKGEEIFVTLDITVTNENGESQVRKLTTSLIEESSGFRINQPTYASYFDKDRYDELQKN
ncbi:MAG: hypothetical protein E7617_00265 [Ruminococcaceae bacterium]|nr:hypothetical protein [Oscillospiraceae bacterium]